MARVDETFVATPRLTAHLFAMLRRCLLALSPLAAFALGGCLSVKTEPIEVKPIHVTVDVNVRVEREVENLVSDIYGNSATVKVPNTPAK
jgi:hypothetical protein